MAKNGFSIDEIVLAARKIPLWILGYTIMPLWFVIGIAVSLMPVSLAEFDFRIPLYWYPLFYWVLTRPHWTPPGLIFILAVIIDFWSQHIVGITTLSLLLVTTLIRFQRRLILGQGFWVSWLAFCIAIITFQTIAWLLTSLTALNIYTIDLNYFMGSLIIIIAYPAFVIPLSISDRIITDARRNLQSLEIT